MSNDIESHRAEREPYLIVAEFCSAAKEPSIPTEPHRTCAELCLPVVELNRTVVKKPTELKPEEPQSRCGTL